MTSVLVISPCVARLQKPLVALRQCRAHVQANAASVIAYQESRLALELTRKAGSLDGLLSGLQGSAVLGTIVLTQSWPAGLLVDLLTEGAIMLCFDKIVARGGGLGPPFGIEPCALLPTCQLCAQPRVNATLVRPVGASLPAPAVGGAGFRPEARPSLTPAVQGRTNA